MKKALVIGQPIAHSKSPIIHQYWLKKYSISGSYNAREVNVEQLEDLTQEIRNGTYVGANVTLPHKTNIVKYCDQLTSQAKTIGAVNTLYLSGKQLVGDNTDSYGFLSNLDQNAPGWDKNLDQAIVLGAGGATRAIICALLTRKFEKITILNRTLSKAEDIANWFSNTQSTATISVDSLKNFPLYAPQCFLLINASSIGLNNTSFEQIDPSLLPKHALVHDIVYTPLMTPLLVAAQSAGLNHVDGLGMLLHQAAPGFEKWFGQFPKVNNDLRQMILNTL